jgi:ribose/xylose/arabinose/galactoside ABC-type transport system permease subunit
MRFLATGDTLLGIPNALVVWAVIGACALFLLNRTTFGRTVMRSATASARPISRARAPAQS